MRWCLLLLMGAVVVLGVEVEEVEEEKVEVDTRERGERADLPPPSRPQRRPGSGAGFSSFLSGLLGSVTQTANVAACPGKCIHALASLMCDTVLEEVQCPSSNMRCCVEKSSGGGSPPNRDSSIPGLGLSMPPRPSGSPPRKDEAEEKEATTENVEEETTKKKKRRKKKDRTTTTTTPATTTKKEAVSTTEETEDDDEDSEEDETSNTTVCPGVCVADRISCFCEAILDIPSLCKENLRCCVAKKIFGSENTPEELIFPKEDSRCKSGSNKEKKDEEEEEDEIMDTAESNTKLKLAKERERKEKEKREKERKEKERKEMEAKRRKEELEKKKQKKKEEEKEKAGLSPEGRCRGTCVTGFFSLLCDEIDRSAICPGQGRCCITRSPPRPPRPTRPDRPPPPKKPLRKAKPPPPPTRPPLPSKNKCPGVCIPDVMLSLCAPPSIVSPKGGCPKGTFCCDHKGQNPLTRVDPGPRPTPPPRPLRPAPPPPQQSSGPDFSKLFLQMAPTLIGAATGSQSTAQTMTSLLPLLGMLGPMLSSNRRTPPPPQQAYRPQATRPPPVTRAPPTTTTTTTTTEKADPRPECPGTCIAPYLSFTCFGNAETTELFGCPKRKTICCSPKSAVKEEKERLARERSSLRQPLPTQREPPPRFWQQEQLNRRRNDSQHEIIPYEPYPFPTTDERPPFVNPVTNKYVCGVKGQYRSGRVVGGEDAAPGEWCWQVALINSLNQYLCGGALIGQSWVLTAAHCVTNIVRAGDAIYVRVGDHDLTQKFGSPGAQTLRVATTYIHHNHNSQTLDNDIALLKLHGDAELKEGVCLVCLPARGTSQATGKKCTVTGYGYMGETGPIPLRIREARVPIVNDNECVRKINTVTEKIFILPASSFCAGGVKGHDACQGDGGGPLVCEDSGYHELTGLVSWGFGCGRKDVPGVYVKVSSFIGWINQIISVNNS